MVPHEVLLDIIRCLDHDSLVRLSFAKWTFFCLIEQQRHTLARLKEFYLSYTCCGGLYQLYPEHERQHTQSTDYEVIAAAIGLHRLKKVKIFHCDKPYVGVLQVVL